VIDTGSTDHTREMTREFGALVFDFVWVTAMHLILKTRQADQSVSSSGNRNKR